MEEKIKKKKQKETHIDANWLVAFLDKEARNPDNTVEERATCTYFLGYIQGMRDEHSGGQKKTALKILEAHEYMKNLNLKNMKVPDTKN